MARTQAPGTRQRILDTASRLFATHGVRAVGMQQVIAETGLGKSLLYREFPSKDELVASWLRESDETYWVSAEAALLPYAGEPARQLLALVEFTHSSAQAEDFHGCVFYNTSAEFREAEHPGRQQAVSHLLRLRDRFVSLGREAGAEAPEDLADALMLIIAGLLTNGSTLGPGGPSRVAVALARTAIEQYCPTPVGEHA